MLNSLPPVSQEEPPRLFELRLGLLFGALLVSPGLHLPYFPVWLEWIGLSPTEIAVVLGAPMLLRMASTPVLAAWADRANDRIHMLAAMLAASLALSAGFLLPPSYGLVLVLSLGLAVVWPVQTSIADAIAVSGVRRWGFGYARMRVWGSISFLLANLGGGAVLAAAGPQSVPAMLAASMALALAVTFAVPRLGRPRTPAPGGAGSATLIGNRRFVLFVTAGGLILASHAFLWSFASILWQDLGLDETTIGALWAGGIAAEAALLLLFPRAMGAMSATTLIAAAGAAAALRWCLFPLVWPLGWGVTGFFFVQALHAASTGLILVAIQKVIAESVPEQRTGAAQGLWHFSTSLTMAAATLASGPLYAGFGAAGFAAMAAVALAGLFVTGLAARSAP